MAQILQGKNHLCLIRQYLRLGSFSLVAWGQVQGRPAGIHRRMVDGRNQPFPLEGHIPVGEDFKEDCIGVQDRSKKHNALVDAHVARDLYLKLEAGRPHSNGSLTH